MSIQLRRPDVTVSIGPEVELPEAREPRDLLPRERAAQKVPMAVEHLEARGAAEEAGLQGGPQAALAHVETREAGASPKPRRHAPREPIPAGANGKGADGAVAAAVAAERNGAKQSVKSGRGGRGGPLSALS